MSESWQLIYEESDAGAAATLATTSLCTENNCAHVKDISDIKLRSDAFEQLAFVFVTKQASSTTYISMAELRIFGTTVETCASCPAGTTTLAAGASSQNDCVCQAGYFLGNNSC